MISDDERPPVGRSWGALYAVVLGALACLIGLFSLLSSVYR